MSSQILLYIYIYIHLLHSSRDMGRQRNMNRIFDETFFHLFFLINRSGLSSRLFVRCIQEYRSYTYTENKSSKREQRPMPSLRLKRPRICSAQTSQHEDWILRLSTG